jgi:hypothetical protein
MRRRIKKLLSTCCLVWGAAKKRLVHHLRNLIEVYRRVETNDCYFVIPDNATVVVSDCYIGDRLKGQTSV